MKLIGILFIIINPYDKVERAENSLGQELAMKHS